jgi:outer membrane immunogenic protein
VKKLLLGGTILAALAVSAPAVAADVSAPVYKAPVVAPAVFSWTGLYVGANLGYSWGRGDTDFTETTSGTSTSQSFLVVFPQVIPVGPPTVVTLPPVTMVGSSRADLNGVIGGGQFGYNWQSGSFVYGIESDLQATAERGDTTICITAGCPTGGIVGSASYKLAWLATLRGRIGVTVTPRVLLYATGGLAAAKIDSTFSGDLGGGPVAEVTSNPFKAGFAVGGGVEGALDTNWSAKLEALYVDLGSYDATLGSGTKTVTTVTGVGLDTVTTTTTTTAGSFHSHVSDFIVRVGLNYRFGGPVVAKY